jgi:RNA polymerase sigma factor (sigma-70 family)
LAATRQLRDVASRRRRCGERCRAGCAVARLADEDHLAIRTSLEAYLYRAVHNRALDERRRTTRRRRLLERGGLNGEPVGEAVSAPAERLPAVLEQALASLPTRRRQVFILAHLHDLTYRQIAQILDLSPQTVANHVSMALADLRRKLAPYSVELMSQDEVALHDHQTVSAG